MTISADASALIAIFAGEADGDDLAGRLDRDPHRLCSAVSLWEAVGGLRRSYELDVAAARTIVNLFVKDFGLRQVSIGEHEYAIALDAYEHYGKGRHPAALNMGDCFAYACAKANGASLLYKGQDFSQTDLA